MDSTTFGFSGFDGQVELSKSAGVGVVYNGALAGLLGRKPQLVDTLSLIPETLWHEASGPNRYQWIPAAMRLFDALKDNQPVVFHGIGLSLGSAGPLDHGHVEQLALAADRYQPRWFSEHLATFRVRSASGPAHAGVGLPVAFGSETLAHLAPKVEELQRRLELPVLLENSAVYVDIPNVEWSEAGLLNRLCDETGCGVLLDLHNLYANERNLKWDAEAYLDEMNLSNVVEIHVAGGEMMGRWYADAHSGASPDRVWELLDYVLPEAKALKLVTFEMHESRFDAMTEKGFLAELSAIRNSVEHASAGEPRVA